MASASSSAHGSERSSAILATAVIHFLQSWIPQVLRLRRVYSRAYFDSQAVTWDPTSAFTLRSHAGPDGSSVQTRAGISVAQFVKDAELCSYLEQVLTDLFQLLIDKKVCDIAVVIWERAPRRPIERHILSLYNVFASVDAIKSRDRDGPPVDDVQLQTAVNDALRRLWGAYKIKEATIDPLPASLQLTWTLAICPPRPIDAPEGWDSGQASVLSSGKHIVPVRTIPFDLTGSSEASIGLSIEVLGHTSDDL